MSNRRDFLETIGGVGASLALSKLAAPASMATVRPGLIGLGARGGSHLRRLLLLEGILVETQERTGLHCMMMENACYGREELMVLNRCRQGLFGELTHGEAAYIHDLREQMKDVARGTGSWRTPHHTRRNGNLFPTPGLGPIAQYMNVNRGDRFDYLTSMSSPALGRRL